MGQDKEDGFFQLSLFKLENILKPPNLPLVPISAINFHFTNQSEENDRKNKDHLENLVVILILPNAVTVNWNSGFS